MVVSYFIKRQIPSEEKSEKFDIFTMVSRAEWDTLLFFFGVIVSVGGLGFMGYLALVSEAMYVQLGATYANVLVGILSAIVDNIPVMFAVLTMTPDMSLGQWLIGYFDSWSWWKSSINWICSWCGLNGPIKRLLYFCVTLKMDLGNCPRICCQYFGPFVD